MAGRSRHDRTQSPWPDAVAMAGRVGAVVAKGRLAVIVTPSIRASARIAFAYTVGTLARIAIK